MEPIRQIANVVRAGLPRATVRLSGRIVLGKGTYPVYTGVHVVIPGMSRRKTYMAVQRALKKSSYFRTRSQDSLDPRSVFVMKEHDEGVSVHLPLAVEKSTLEAIREKAVEAKLSQRTANRETKRVKARSVKVRFSKR
ncbi:MAG: hypothetical protein V1881_03420 [Candidatus Micrarchaeota archaeon]